MTTTTSFAENLETDDESSSSNADEGPEYQVESLVSGRAKRATAGNRLASLLEGGDDELELLFAEEDGEEDVEFEGADSDGASDVALDSSTDDEENDPAGAEDELDGERELQKQDRTERHKKRKAHEVFKRPGKLRKKTMIDPTSNKAVPRSPVARPRKKSERVSWIPTPEDGPTRSSTRKQTVQNKKSVHLRMVESEKRRVQLIQVMEEAAKRKEASRPKLLTQAERMEEAARTEERNAKSLNRWEATEKKRSDEQKAKLEALQNRQLSGPVITWWSGMASWVNGKLIQVGCRGAKDAPEDEAVGAGDTVSKNDSEKRRHDETGVTDPDAPGDMISPSKSPSSDKVDHSQPRPTRTLQSTAITGTGGFPDDNRNHGPLSGEPRFKGFYEGQAFHHSRAIASNSRHAEALPPTQPPKPPSTHYAGPLSDGHPRGDFSPNMIEHSSRNMVIFDNIDVNDMRLPELPNHALLRKRNGKPPR